VRLRAHMCVRVCVSCCAYMHSRMGKCVCIQIHISIDERMHVQHWGQTCMCHAMSVQRPDAALLFGICAGHLHVCAPSVCTCKYYTNASLCGYMFVLISVILSLSGWHNENQLLWQWQKQFTTVCVLQASKNQGRRFFLCSPYGYCTLLWVLRMWSSRKSARRPPFCARRMG